MKITMLRAIVLFILVGVSALAQMPAAVEQVGREPESTRTPDTKSGAVTYVILPTPVQKEYFVGLSAIYNLLDDGVVTPQAQGVFSLWDNILGKEDISKAGMSWNIAAVTNAGTLSAKEASTSTDTVKSLLKKVMTSGDGLSLDLYVADLRIRTTDDSQWLLNPFCSVNLGIRTFSDTLSKETFSVSRSGLALGLGVCIPKWAISPDKQPMAYFAYRYSWVMNNDNYEKAYRVKIDDAHPSSMGHFNFQFVGPILPAIGFMIDGKIGSFVPQWSVGLLIYK